MKNLFKGLFIAVFALMVLPVNADDFKDFIDNSNRGPQPISKHQVDNLRNQLIQNHQANVGSRAADITLILDYFTCEEEAAINDGFDWQQFVWEVNRNFPQINYPTFKWVMSDFYTYTGYDADDPNAVCADYDVNSYTLDSVYIPLAYLNTTNSIDTLIVSIYDGDWSITGQGPSDGITPNTVVLWTDTFISGTDFFTGPEFQLQNFTVFPNLSFAAQEFFATRVDFVGDTTNKFRLLAGYRDECADAEGASANVVVPLNSVYFINADLRPQGSIQLSGINSVGFTYPVCDEFFTQNWLMWPFLTANVNFSVSISASAEEGCDGDVIDLTATASGSAGTLTYSWGATTGQLTSNSGPQTSLVLGSSNSWVKVTVTDGSQTIVDSVLITSNAISVSLPTTIGIDCGDDSLIIAQVSGNLNQVQYAWSGPNGTSSSPTYTVDNPGGLNVTVTNSSGCSDDDNSNVIIVGVSQVLSFTVRNVTALIIDSTCYQVNQPTQLTNTSSEISGWEFEWSYPGGSTGLSQPTIQFTATGLGEEITLEATQVGNPNCIISKVTTIDILPSGSCPTTGVEETYLNSLISMYPNPTNGEFTINFTELANEDVSIEIYNLIGTRVYTNNLQLTGNDFETVDLSSNANGVYLIKIQVGNDVLSKTVTLNK